MAVDVAVTAKRLGVPKVTMICLESREQMPAGREEIERVLEEGIEIKNGWGPMEILKESVSPEEDRITGCLLYTSPDSAGALLPVWQQEG